MAKKQLTIVIDGDDSSNYWVTSVQEIPGCRSQGKTLTQALERTVEAMAVCGVPIMSTPAHADTLHQGIEDSRYK
jgi:predicted RNase H-like HicB family nuclease